jgi:pyrrolidone-carboxylate peptidase
MIYQNAEAQKDRRPAIVICAYDTDHSVWDPIEDLSGEPWSPQGARTVAVPSADPESLASTLSDHMAETNCRALLLVGRTRRSDAFRLQMRAENRAVTGGLRADVNGPAMARVTVPVAEIVRELNAAGLAADASSEAEEDAGSYLLYRVLSGLPYGPDAPAIGLLRIPDQADEDAVRRGIKVAATAIARHLAPLARS